MKRLWLMALLAWPLASCDDGAPGRTTGPRCVDLSDCPRQMCNCGDGQRGYAVCEEGRCAKDCEELCRARARL